MTRRVLTATTCYALLSLVDISYRGVQPVFFAASIELGGLGLSPLLIGAALTALGPMNGLFQVFCFSKIHDRFGARNLFIFSICCGFPVISLFPVMSAIATAEGRATTLVWVIIGLQLAIYVLFNMAYSKC